ncbi:MAG: hypothetical protein ORO03_09630 [Alphaproteobacteria bacterium]|nr:hypothetical protein [Alphaproteobacteria bacterium]
MIEAHVELRKSVKNFFVNPDINAAAEVMEQDYLTLALNAQTHTSSLFDHVQAVRRQAEGN